jgi:hypothetical protein
MRITSLATVCLFMVALAMSAHGNDKITLQQVNGKLRVNVGKDLFTEYDYQTYARPILYPVMGPGQVPMTRNHPMKPGVEGEAKDHPHHKSIWFAHGDINGTSFWHEKGKIVHERIVSMDEDAERPTITLSNTWVDGNGKPVCTDTTKLAFLLVPHGRAIDFDFAIHASHGDLKFGDTKEGTFALRTHPNLRLTNKPKSGVTAANGQAVNSEGVSGKPVWGKKAKWVDYFGKIDDKLVGIAIFDHPDNLRHPTTWHARDYGLVAANPFGLSHFLGQPRGSGDYTLKSGKDLRFRYRVVFHEGDTKQAEIAQLFEQYAAE